MAIQFQYNKTFLQELGKALKIRMTALPTLMAREAALRQEVKSARAEVERLTAEFSAFRQELSAIERLWPEFPFDHLSVSRVHIQQKKVAGVRIPFLEQVEFDVKPISLFVNPHWWLAGFEFLKKMVIHQIRNELAEKKVKILESARKKTTQKVNLYEKVQIPGYQEAIRKIKRFLEDEETLAKSSQKILKEKLLSYGAA